MSLHADVVAAGPARGVPADLLAALAAVTDPRCRRGVRHQLVAVLGLAICTAIRRMPQAIDPVLLNQVVIGWLVARSDATAPTPATVSPTRRPWPVIAVDGMTVRGARTTDQLGQVRRVHLLAAFDTATGTVLAQTVLDGKTNGITAFARLLDALDIAGTVVTADALHTQRGHTEYLHGRGAHYLLTIEGNHRPAPATENVALGRYSERQRHGAQDQGRPRSQCPIGGDRDRKDDGLLAPVPEQFPVHG